jgi:hypothetical protein
MGETKNACKILIGKSEWKGAVGRAKRDWKLTECIVGKKGGKM